MDIRLNRLNVKNFQGIKSFELVIGGKNASILADNAKGKTTIYNAFTWLISGKDSFNRSDFGIKPLDENGAEVHFLETEVEAELLVDGNPVKMKKIQTENWVKPRGQTEQEYKGNNTAHFFDEVPMGATEYKSKVDALIGEEVFRLLTNPLYFNQHYKVGKLTDWQSRRMLLFEMCGAIPDETIIQMNPDLAKLPEVLAGKSIDDRKAIIAQSIKKLNEEIVKISPKINENMRLIPEVGTDYTATEQKLSRAKAQLEEIEKELTGAGNVAQVHMQMQKDLFALKNQLESVKSRIFKEANAGYQRFAERKVKLESEKYSLESMINQHKRNIESNNSDIEADAITRQVLIDEWKKLTAELQGEQLSQFVEPTDDFVCPTCGQDLPEDNVEQKLTEMRANFNASKDKNIKAIELKVASNVAKGKSNQSNTAEAKRIIEESEATIKDSESKLAVIVSSIASVNSDLDKPIAEPDYTKNAEFNELSGKIKALESEINKPIEDTSLELRTKKNAITTEIEECNSILNNRDNVANAKARIEELKQSEKDLSNQKSQFEGQLNLITEFIRAKANTLTDIMNSKFKHVKFELFETQINGGMIECCNTLVNTNGCWVPFTDGNTAGKINAGIDITVALASYYGVTTPLFIDNAESVTELIDTPAQIIRLVKPDIQTEEVRRKYSKLSVEEM